MEPENAPASRGYNDSTTGGSAEKRQRLAQICEILGLSEADKLIEEIEARLPKVPKNHRQRRSAKLNESKVGISEI